MSYYILVGAPHLPPPRVGWGEGICTALVWLRSDRGFIKSMKVRAAKLQDDSISLINFTPNRAYKRYIAIKKICDQI